MTGIRLKQSIVLLIIGNIVKKRSCPKSSLNPYRKSTVLRNRMKLDLVKVLKRNGKFCN